MAQLILIDTDILIDVGRNIEEAVDCLTNIEQQNYSAISVITKMELLVGSRNKKELKEIEKFIERFQIINLNEAISDKAFGLLKEYRLSHGLLIPDALIGATAIVSGVPLVSKNQRDFKFIKELELIDYPS